MAVTYGRSGLKFLVPAHLKKKQKKKNECLQPKTGISAVFGPSTQSSSGHCINICDTKEIPFIDVNLDAFTMPPVINMHPHPDALANIFIDLIKAYDWQAFTIIYESGNFLATIGRQKKDKCPLQFIFLRPKQCNKMRLLCL